MFRSVTNTVVWDTIFFKLRKQRICSNEIYEKICNVHCVNPLTKRINSTELTQQQTVIVLCVIYLSVCLLYLRFYIERTWFCSIYYDHVLGGSLMHEVEHIKPQMTRATRTLPTWSRFHQNQLLLCDLYLFYISPCSHSCYLCPKCQYESKTHHSWKC